MDRKLKHSSAFPIRSIIYVAVGKGAIDVGISSFRLNCLNKFISDVKL